MIFFNLNFFFIGLINNTSFFSYKGMWENFEYEILNKFYYILGADFNTKPHLSYKFHKKKISPYYTKFLT